LAAKIPVVLHELAPQSASLEEAFMELTEDSIEYHGTTTAGPTNSTGAKS
jgi:ABC-2 type transport system ATP-binding protein